MDLARGIGFTNGDAAIEQHAEVMVRICLSLSLHALGCGSFGFAADAEPRNDGASERVGGVTEMTACT